MFVGPAETGLLMRYGMQSAKIPLAFAFHRASPEDAQSSPWHTAALAITRPAAPVYSAEPFAWPAPVTRNAFDARAPHWTMPAAITPVSAPSSAPALPQQTPQAPRMDAAVSTHVDTMRTAHELADAGRLDEAAATVNAYLEQHAPHADAFYLLGVLADATGETNVARVQYRKAIYLDPRHTEALAHLATLLELEGDRAGARLLMQRASRAQGACRA
jgi:chemotaxis protein methyltransferase WspC